MAITTFKISKKLNIKYGRLREWIDRGYIKPSKPATGQGSKSEFTLFDVYMVELFSQLLSRGFSRGVAAENINSEIKENLHYKFGRPLYKSLIAEDVWIVFSRVRLKNDKYKMKNMVICPELDGLYSETSSELITNLLIEGPEDIYIVNFNRIKQKVDSAFL